MDCLLVLACALGGPSAAAAAAAFAPQETAQTPPPPQRRPGSSTSSHGPTRPWPFFPVGPAWSLDLGASPAAPPAFSASRAYVPLHPGTLTAVDLDSGTVVWTAEAATTIGPTTDGGRVFVVGDGEVQAIDGGDGRSLWRVPLAAPASRRAAARGGWVVLALDSGEVLALRAADGATVWKGAVGGPPPVDPIIEGDRLYVASPATGVVAFDLLSGQVVWTRRVEGPVSALAVVPGAIYVGTGGRWFYALKENSGDPKWHWRVAGEPIGIGVDERVVVTLMLDHTMRAFRVGNGAQDWREELVYRPFAGPVKAPGQWLVVGHGPLVRAYNEIDGSRAGSYTLSPPGPADAAIPLDVLVAPPYVREGATVFDDLMVLLTQRGTLHGARRELTPRVAPLTVMPGAPLSVPAAPPAGPAPPAATTRSTPP